MSSIASRDFIPVDHAEVTDQGNSNFVLPPSYVFSDGDFAKEREQISRNMSFYDGDGRYKSLFDCICAYANSKNNAFLYFQNVFRFILKTGISQVRGETNIKRSTEILLEKLKDNNYCDVIRSKSSHQIVSFILKDPCFSILDKYLGKFYARENDYRQMSSQLSKVLFFPSYTALSKKFNFSVEKIKSISNVVSASDMNKITLKEKNNSKKLLVIDFPTKGRVSPFEIVIGNNDIDKIVNRCLLPILFEVINTRPKLLDGLKKNFFKEKGNESVDFKSLMLGTNDINSDNVIKWLDNFQKFTNDVDFIQMPEKYLTSFDISTPVVKRLESFIPRALYFSTSYGYGLVEYKNQQEKDKEKNQKIIVKYLCESAKRSSSSTYLHGQHLKEYSYVLVSFDHILQIRDVSGQSKLSEKYSQTEIKELLSMRDNEGPKIFELQFKDKSFYLHRWRLIDVFYSAVMMESMLVQEKIASKWASIKTKDIPASKSFVIEPSDLSYRFQRLYLQITQILEKYNIFKLVEILFPNKSEAGIYGLHNSDLINPKKYDSKTNSFRPITQVSKLKEIKEMLYHKGDTLNKIPLKKVLNLDYGKIYLSSEEKRKKASGILENKFIFVNWIIDVLFAWMMGINKKKKKVKLEPSIKANRNEIAKQSTKNIKVNPLKNIASRFNIPSSHSALSSKLNALDGEWNKVIIDPKLHYPNWTKLLPPQRDKLKAKLRSEVMARRKEAKYRVDKTIRRTYSELDLSKITNQELIDIADRLAKIFKSPNHACLRNYIKHYIVQINSK